LPRGQALSGESVRSIRPYVSGDPQHLVHWPSTARLGSLVVRELEPPVATGVAIVLDLSAADQSAADQSAAEEAASQAAGLAESAFAQGSRVMLCTAQADGPVRSEVSGLLQLRRRLALATSGVPAQAPDGWPILSVTHPLEQDRDETPA